MTLHLLFFFVNDRMGALKRTKPDSQKEQKFKVTKIIVHESYNKPKEMSHDIALLKLNQRAQMDR